MVKRSLLMAAIVVLAPQFARAADIPGNKTTKAVLATGGAGLDGISEIANDSDWYKVTLKAGQNYAMTVRADGCTVINLRDSKGKALRNSQACQTSAGGYDGGFEFMPTKAGTYFVELLDKASKKIPSKYHVTAIADAAGSIKTAATLAVGRTNKGELNWKNDTDFFAINLTKGSKYSLSVSGYYDAKAISLRLADANGKFVSGFNTTKKTAYTNFTVPKTGKYFAVVTGLGNKVGGRYNIAFKDEGGAPAGPGIPEGIYKAADGTLCEVVNYQIPGRTRSYLTCDRTTGYHFELATVTGSISTGHPYLAQLLAKEVDKMSGASTFSWGLELNNSFLIGGCGYFSTGTPVGSQVAGNSLTLSMYYSGGIYCSASLKKQ